MTPQEWTALKDHVTALWGKNRKWANYGKIINQVQHVTYEDAIRYIDNVVVVGGFIPSPADIIAIKPQCAVPALPYVSCGDHYLKLVEGPFSPPFQACMNVGCDYKTSKLGDQNNEDN